MEVLFVSLVSSVCVRIDLLIEFVVLDTRQSRMDLGV